MGVGQKLRLPRFSPRERGCSHGAGRYAEHGGVFPARAGMFLNLLFRLMRYRRFPRASGDVPDVLTQDNRVSLFSPRERGCSEQRGSRTRRGTVFPARAGMFRMAAGKLPANPGFPRASGDVPPRVSVGLPVAVFSPRERGCSVVDDRGRPAHRVFPARAGMFRRSGLTSGLRWGFPRASGDVPRSKVRADSTPSFSPRERGCSQPTSSALTPCPVFPARAGMFP